MFGIERLKSRIEWLEKRVREIDCPDHMWNFVGRDYGFDNAYVYAFKCLKCGATTWAKEENLTPQQRAVLVALKIIEDKKKGK
jgi:uncharacterized protein CbrC (UPF0167 family)